MDWINLVSMIVGILSLFATIAISIVIYLLQRKNEKNQHQNELKEKAIEVLQDNIDEKEYLPLAQFAAKLNPLYMHIRKIYNKFSRCNIEYKKKF